MYNEVLRSSKDASINFITPTSDGGKIEARFVQRREDTIIVYLSSMTGCNLSCRFCHLTQMKETTMSPVDIEGYCTQAEDVLDLVSSERRIDKVTIVHFNFMARGDALSNPFFVERTDELFTRLTDLAKPYGLLPKFKISSIFPQDLLTRYDLPFLKNWIETLQSKFEDVEFYYSLYSLFPEFRKRWIPKAMDPDIVGELFRDTTEKLRLHYALINNENSSITNTRLVIDWLMKHNIKCRFNIVRYNPFNRSSSVEASDGDIRTYGTFMNMSPSIVDVHLISRVGEDVSASCGTFV